MIQQQLMEEQRKKGLGGILRTAIPGTRQHVKVSEKLKNID